MVRKMLSDVTQLGDVAVDDVLGTTDVEESARLPTPSELYDRWERQHWTVQELDFSVDQQQWAALPDEHRRRHLGTFIGFLHGEVMVTETLHPYAMSAPRQDQRLYLTTQIVDEARHVAFFNRFFRDVLGYADHVPEQMLEATRDWRGDPYNYLFDVGLMEASERINRERGNLTALTAGIVIYHLLIENMLALAFQRSALAAYRKQGFLPGFRAGFMAVTRDESRHVLFGIGFLRDAMREDPRQRDVILETIDRWLPVTLEIFNVPEEIIPALMQFGIDPIERQEFGKLSLRKKLGILNLPVPEIAKPAVSTPA